MEILDSEVFKHAAALEWVEALIRQEDYQMALNTLQDAVNTPYLDLRASLQTLAAAEALAALKNPDYPAVPERDGMGDATILYF